MTTSVMPEQPTTPAPVEGDRRIIPIFANLMPMEVVDTRRGRQARRMVLVGLAILLVVVGGLYTLTVLQTAVAQRDLTSTEDRALQLKRQQQQYAEVVKTQEDSRKLEGQLTDLMASDLRWSSLLSSVRGAAPAGVGLDTVTGNLTPKEQAAAAGAAEDTKLPSTSTAKPVGTLTVTGRGPSKPVIAAYVDALAKVDGLTDPHLASITDADEGLQFNLQVTLTDEAFGGRFAKPDDTTNGKTGGR